MATYNDLVADLKNFMENQSAEYIAAIPTIVRLAEARIYREVNISSFDTVATGTIGIGDTSIPTPVDLIQPRHLRITLPSGAVKVLAIKELEYLLIYAPDNASQLQPTYYAVETPTTYRIAPASDGSYPYTLAYRRRLPALGPTNQQNFLTDVAYDLLFAACMAESGRFILDDRQASIITLWENRYKEAVATITGVERRSERDDFRQPTKSIQNE